MLQHFSLVPSADLIRCLLLIFLFYSQLVNPAINGRICINLSVLKYNFISVDDISNLFISGKLVIASFGNDWNRCGRWGYDEIGANFLTTAFMSTTYTSTISLNFQAKQPLISFSMLNLITRYQLVVSCWWLSIFDLDFIVNTSIFNQKMIISL